MSLAGGLPRCRARGGPQAARTGRAISVRGTRSERSPTIALLVRSQSRTHGVREAFFSQQLSHWAARVTASNGHDSSMRFILASLPAQVIGSPVAVEKGWLLVKTPVASEQPGSKARYPAGGTSCDSPPAGR